MIGAQQPQSTTTLRESTYLHADFLPALPACASMDSRRLQELRDVYTQLSQQSTGPDGAQAGTGAAFGQGDNNSAGLSQGSTPTQPAPARIPAGSSGRSASPSGGAASLPAPNRAASFMSDTEHDGGDSAAAGAGIGTGTGGKRKRKRSERNSFYPGSYFEWTDELMVSAAPYTHMCSAGLGLNNGIKSPGARPSERTMLNVAT